MATAFDAARQEHDVAAEDLKLALDGQAGLEVEIERLQAENKRLRELLRQALPCLRTHAHPLAGQTLVAHKVTGEGVICLYRRMDRPGLWAQLACVAGGRWVNEAQYPLWGAGGFEHQ